jgi:guanidinopropionase
MTDDAREQLETLYWWGVPTFFRCPHDEDPARCDIGVLGVPHSSGNGSTERDQHLGPRAVRHVSAHNRRPHRTYGIHPFEALRVHDLGDVALPEAMDNEACVERIAAATGRVAAAGTRLVSIGGDHATTGAVLLGLAGAASPLTNGPVALIHFDAHVDSYSQIPHWLGARRSAAHWAAYLVADGRVDPARSTQIGMRGQPRTETWLDTSRQLGYDVVTMADCRRRSLDDVAEAARARAGDGPVYITFDLDSLDPSVAPAVSNLEIGEGGFSIDEANLLLRGLRGLDIVGGDVVCLMPTKDDAANRTAMVAGHIAFEQVALIADRVVATRRADVSASGTRSRVP